MASETVYEPPPKWGDDPLTDYFEIAHKNRWASFVHEHEGVSLLLRIDAWLETLRKGLINPKHHISALLLLRAQLLFRATCELALSGNHYASMPVQRACLEAAAYALWCAKDAEALKVWMDRDESDQTRKAARSFFKHGDTKKAIAKCDNKLAEIYAKLYDRAIDFGAHPNALGIWVGSEIQPAGDDYAMMQIGLHGRDAALDAAMKSSAQTGVFIVRIAEPIWPERVGLLGLIHELWSLRKSC